MEKQWVDLINWYQNNMQITDMAVGVCLIVLLYSLFQSYGTGDWAWLNTSPKRRGKMLRKARRDYINQLMTDDFVSSVEDRVYHGILTREEAKEIYRELKKCFPIRNLFPSPELLKEAIKKRLATKVHDPVSLPGKVVPLKPKHMFDKTAA